MPVQYVPVVCGRCGKDFQANAWRQSSPKYAQRFCSKACAVKHYPPIEDRFWAKTEKREDGCWIWVGSLNNYGYPQFYEDGKVLKSHRWAFERWVGPIPRGRVLMHSCDRPACVNPAHLSIGTTQQNSQDAVRKGRMARSGKRVSQEMKDLVFQMLKLCIPRDKIAVALSLSPKTVRGYAKQLELAEVTESGSAAYQQELSKDG